MEMLPLEAGLSTDLDLVCLGLSNRLFLSKVSRQVQLIRRELLEEAAARHD